MKKILIAIIIIVLLGIGAYLVFFKSEDKEIYQFKDDSFSYSIPENSIKYELTPKYKNDSLEVYSVKFASRNFLKYNTTIYGLLFMPEGKANVPGLVLLPGGGGSKEGETRLATLIAKQGYAVLTIDQRGVGETGGYYLSLEDDYGVFSKGKEPVQHLSVYDALASWNVLREMKKVDKNNVAIAGESMGGRYALIAAALDSRIKGVIGISASGFNIKNDDSVPYNEFLVSIDPDHYVDRIAPRPLFLFSSKNDSVVPLSAVQNTYDLAGEPKKLFVVENCSHGYCQAMEEELKKDLNVMFGKNF